MATRTRESGYRNTNNKKGEIHVILKPEVAKYVREYCKDKMLNCGKFVNQIVMEQMQKLIEERYASMSREELLAELKALGGMR